MLTDISLTPLIDTAFTLLIIFMVATPMMHNAIRVTLPKGDSKETGSTKQELVVFVDKEGSIFFNNKKITFDELITELKTDSAQIKDQTLFVKADTTASYGLVVELVDRVKRIGGIKYVALATTKSA
jgi:biopolymer transport protein ExbD